MQFRRSALTLALATAGALMLTGCGGSVGSGSLGASSVTCKTTTGCSGGTTTDTATCSTVTGCSGTGGTTGGIACQTATGCSGTGGTGDDDEWEDEALDDRSVSSLAPTLVVVPSLGEIHHASVRLYDASLALVGTADTGSGGTAYLPAVTGPVVVAVTGDADATYFDEAANTTLSFPGGTLHAAVPSGAKATGVTILTELAWQMLQRTGEPVTDASVNAANETVRAALAPQLPGILVPPTRWSAATTAGSLGATPADEYALLLAAIAHLGAGTGTPALDALDQLRADTQDGVIDGIVNGSPDAAWDSQAALAAALRARMQSLAVQYGDPTLQAALAGSQP